MSALVRGQCSQFRAVASLLGLAFAGCISASAVNLPPGYLTAAQSGNNLVLSFQTTTTNYYGVQMSPDLSQPWTNVQAGLQGYGLVKTVTMSNVLLASQGFYRTVIQPKPTQLLLSQATAFAIIGYDCGGIQEKVYLTGFDPTNGYATGNVELKTVCSCGKLCSTTHTASANATWDLTGNVVSTSTPATGTGTTPTFIATDNSNDIIFNSGANAYLIVPVPAAPTGVAAVQSGDQFQVSWTPNGVNPAAIVSSTLTATPTNSTASALTAIVAGPATNGIIPTLQPSTTYQISVVSTTVGGSSSPSDPVSVTTSPATILPSVPTNVVTQWLSPGADPGPNTIVTTWHASDPGNSPIDEYLVTAIGSEIGGTFTNSVSGTTLTSEITADSNYNWSVTVQAHNAAGWGPVSAVAHLGGL